MQVNKASSVSNDMVTVGRKTDMATQSLDVQKSPDSSRVAQLEQNLRFLQEQHQMMLAGLHNEIDNLRHRNRGNCKNNLFAPFLFFLNWIS